MTKLNPYKRKFTVKLRRDIGEVKPEAEIIDGNTYFFFDGWIIGEDDHSLYLGEIARMPEDNNYPRSAPRWIASGDLIELNVPSDEVKK